MKWSMALIVFAGAVLVGSPALAQPATGALGFNGTVSGFPTGEVRITGGGAYNLDFPDAFVQSAGGFRCLSDVNQGPLTGCLAGEGVRWDTVSLRTTTNFKCTGAAAEQLKTATTTDKTVGLVADFYRHGDGNEESFTAQMIVSEVEIAPNDFPGANMWIQGVGCGQGIVHFR